MGESDGEEVKVGDTTVTDTHPSHALARLFLFL